MIFGCWYGGELKIEPQENAFEFEAKSGWNNVVPFSRIFAVQGFFVIVMVYLQERGSGKLRSKQERGKRVYVYSGIIIAVNAFTYGFCDSAALYLNLTSPIVYIWDLGFVLLGFILILI